MRVGYLSWVGVGLLVVGLLPSALPCGVALADDTHHGHFLQQVLVPEADRFTPFALTIEVGDVVEWVNNDTDDHTVVSDDVFNTTGPVGLNHLLPRGRGQVLNYKFSLTPAARGGMPAPCRSWRTPEKVIFQDLTLNPSPAAVGSLALSERSQFRGKKTLKQAHDTY